MSDATPTPSAPADTGADHDEDREPDHHPRGTMAVTLLFLLGTAIVWIWTFTMLIGRSGS